METLGVTHERIPINTPNMNAYIESFHSILEDECYSRYEFGTFADAYKAISWYLHYYNHKRRHVALNTWHQRFFTITTLTKP